MIDRFTAFLYRKLCRFVLRGYGWKRRKELTLSRSTLQWQDPMTGLWYGEKVALRLLRIQTMDPDR